VAGLAVTVLAGPGAAAQTAPAEATTPVMVVLDASSSMKQADAPGPRIDAAKRAVRDLVGALPDGARVGLMAFGTATGPTKADKAAGCKDVRTLVPVQPLDRAGFTGVVGGIRASGFTPIGTALRAAAAALPSAGPRSVVLVSDGEDTCAPPEPCQVAGELKAAGVDLVVHTIGFKVEAKARSELSCVAAATGGSYREASSGADLARALTSRVQRAIRPYAAVGTPVRGGATPADAPLVGPGQYLDTYERAARGGAATARSSSTRSSCGPGTPPGSAPPWPRRRSG
jgi:Ca-activated chloride channel homolog